MYRTLILMYFLTGIITGCKKHVPSPSNVISTPHQWQKIVGPVSGYNSDIYFTSKDTGFIFGSLGSCYILRTVDGGNSWSTLVSFASNYPIFNCFYPVNAKTLFIARDSLYKSSDGGINWLKSNAWNGTTAYQITFTDNQTGFILTNDKIYTTTDLGNTWKLSVALNGSFKALVFPDKLHGFASGGADIEQNGTYNVASVGSLAASADGGQTWAQLDTGSWINGTQRFKSITAMDFLDADHGLIAMDNNTLAFTSDGGLHWSTLNKNLPAIISQLKYEKSGKVFLVSGSKVYSSDNNGQTIGLEFSAGDELLKIGVTPDNRIFLVGRAGQIFKRM